MSIVVRILNLPANINCFGYDNMCNTDWLSNMYPVAWVFDYVMIICTMFVSYPMLLSDQYKSNHCLCVVISTAIYCGRLKQKNEIISMQSNISQ